MDLEEHLAGGFISGSHGFGLGLGLGILHSHSSSGISQESHMSEVLDILFFLKCIDSIEKNI
jgi:hypothetical protein